MKRIDLKTTLKKLFAYRPDEAYTFDEACTQFERWKPRACAYARGEVCLKAGYPAKEIVVVASGLAHVKLPSPMGAAILAHVVRPGEYWGVEHLFAPQSEYPYDLVAAADGTEIVSFSAATLRQNRTDPRVRPILDLLGQQMSGSLTAALAKNTILAGGDITERLRRYLALRIEETGSKTVRMQGTRDDLAAYLGVNRCALSRVIGQLRDAGKIALGRGTITVSE